jgi:hypothetical protein
VEENTMTDEREFLPEDEYPDDVPPDDGLDELLPEERLDDVLSALEAYDDTSDEFSNEEMGEEDIEPEEAPDEDQAVGDEEPDQATAAQDNDLTELDEEERLRQPRAQLFRRRLRNQINMLPLALYLLALGGYLIAREQDIKGLPDPSTLALGEISVLVLAFAVIFRVLLNGRQERGLLLIGVWVWITAGMLFVLVYGIDRQPDAREWWPLLLWSLGVTFVLVYPVERTHDTRLIWLGMITLVAGIAAYGITSDRIDRQSLSDAADYWPLLLSIVGVGLLPLAFRRRLGQ